MRMYCGDMNVYRAKKHFNVFLRGRVCGNVLFMFATRKTGRRVFNDTLKLIANGIVLVVM